MTVYGREDILQVETPPATVALKTIPAVIWPFSEFLFITSQSHEHCVFFLIRVGIQVSALTHNLLSSFFTLNSIRIRWGPVLRLVPCVEGNGRSVINAYMQIFWFWWVWSPMSSLSNPVSCNIYKLLIRCTKHVSVNEYVHETLFSLGWQTIIQAGNYVSLKTYLLVKLILYKYNF